MGKVHPLKRQERKPWTNWLTKNSPSEFPFQERRSPREATTSARAGIAGHEAVSVF